MTLREIMKTNVGPERLEPSLPQETEIHHLRPEVVDEGVVYEVVNELGDNHTFILCSHKPVGIHGL